MGGNIFGTLDSYFSLYKHIMDNVDDTRNIYSNECKHIQEMGKEDDHHLKYIKRICLNWFPYLLQIQFKGEKERREGLQYMYYWLYRYYKNDDIVEEDLNTLYKKLITRYNQTSFAQRTGKPTLPDDINGQQWEILIDICKLNTELNNIKKFLFDSSEKQIYCDYAKGRIDTCMQHIVACNSNSSPTICKIFINIKNEINEIILEKGCYNINKQISPSSNFQNESLDSSRTNNSGTIIIFTV
ncbi:variable surface protein, partial [Plasmodium gonderi]